MHAIVCLMHANLSSNDKSTVTDIKKWHKSPENFDISTDARMVDSIHDIKVTSLLVPRDKTFADSYTTINCIVL